MHTSEITLVLFYLFSNHLNNGLQIVRILSSWGSWFCDSLSILVGTISGLNKKINFYYLYDRCTYNDLDQSKFLIYPVYKKDKHLFSS